MENKKELKLGYKIALIICSVLVLANLVVEIVEMTDITFNMVLPIIGILSMVAVLYYAYIGYKKPHGNLLRNAFFIYALLDAAYIIACPATAPKYMITIFMIEVVLITYMSGRLNKLNQNKIIIAIVGICTLVNGVCYFVRTPSISIIQLFHAFSSFIGWATLSVAYLSRYEAHTEAGLADK